MLKLKEFFNPQKTVTSFAMQTSRTVGDGTKIFPMPPCENVEFALYETLRNSVPLIDAAISKIVRLVGGFKVICSDEKYQALIDDFVSDIKVGASGISLYSFMDSYLDSLLTYGSAVGEIIINPQTMSIEGLYNASLKNIEAVKKSPIETDFFRKATDGSLVPIKNPQLILFSALSPKPEKVYGTSILKGLPYISSILLRIYECIGQNFDRIGNVRYAVTYKPQDSNDKAFAKDRAIQIAKEWSEGMQASKNGIVRDFVAVGDVQIKAIGADNQIIDTNIPVRQLLEQIVAKLSIPPFLLGLSWSSTERMSAQQADILTSELEYYRRLLNPVIKKISQTFLKMSGIETGISIEWDNINLQDETALADARLKNAQALEIEMRLEQYKNN